MTCRIARTVALTLPVLFVCVIAATGGWRLHDGRVERVSHDSAAAAAPAVTSATPRPGVAAVDQVTIVRHLSPSVPWQAWAGLAVLCALPAVASLLAWSGARRGRATSFSTPGGSP